MNLSNSSSQAVAISISALTGVLLFWAVILVIFILGHGPALTTAASAAGSLQIDSAYIGFFGVCVGWLATHLFTTFRDRRNRRGAFAGYLLQWRSNLARVPPDDAPRVWDEYLKGVHTYHMELGKIIEDYRSNEEFMNVSDHLGNLQHETIQGQKKRAVDIVCTPLDKLRAIVRAKWEAPKVP